MKVAIVLGRGLEGCGVTKYTVELERWLLNNSHTPMVYASKDKRWSRNDSHEIQNLVHVRFDRDDFDDALDFMGWFISKTYKVNGISKWDAYAQYLNYHEGWGGSRM